ncbi:hypothetical protein D9Q98_001137 [Chlorella vulgaris]|uniref:Uncharacterized protein n=1 Tax=Chlorella vulgaris TaxID=3077 RepID=A0A9D4TZM6_CHLVU|nr:hypothetical protein D9Q98_001137 [Chlorella vulgaris]
MPAVAPEPILDVVRGLSTLASFAIVVNQLKNIYDAFFINECDRCRGTGLVTCPHCHGTKSLRKRPGYLRTRDFNIVDDPRDSYPCFYCGPNSPYDFNPFLPDDEQKAMQVQENLKMAVANVFPRPFDSRPTAGTVACPLCLGSPCVHRLTPDFAKALNMGPLWDEQIVGRMGRWYWGADRPADKQKLFLEYPTAPVRDPIELPAPRKAVRGDQDPPKPDDKPGMGARPSGWVTRASDLEDYVITYASDDERR